MHHPDFDPDHDRGPTRVAMVEHRELDALVLSYTHLKNLPRQDDALRTLKKIASLVKPIMRARGWKVSELSEFYPEQQNLLGMACYLERNCSLSRTNS